MITIAVLAAAAGLAAPPPMAATKCPGETTLEINDCMSAELAKAEDDLKRYLAAARRRLKSEATDNPDALTALADLDKTETTWAAYREAECDAVYDYWKSGTIRGAMALTCEIDLTRRRTHTVWNEWLTYMDSTPPILPEPSTAPAP
jgi:uncharacterized protein YecT (DUF1311 family)